VIDGCGSQFEVPGLIKVDLAQSVLGAVCGQPSRGLDGPDVDRVPGHMRRCVGCGNPSGSFLFRAVLGNRLTKKLILVPRGTPAAGDEERDVVISGIRRRFAQGLEQPGGEVGYAGKLVIKDGHAVGEGAVSLVRRTSLVAVKIVDGWKVMSSGMPPDIICLPGHRCWSRWNGSRTGIVYCR
jgi:hypothetical protein